MGKIKKEMSNIPILKHPSGKPITIRNMKGAFFTSPEKTKIDFPPKKISSIKFQQELISEIENVNLFGNYSSNKSYVNTSVSRLKKPFKLNPLKLSKVQKKVLKIDDFILLESELPNIFLNEYGNKFNFNSQQLKEFNKKLIQELKKLNILSENNAKIEVASNNKKLINKKAYKTYDKVFGDKFKLDFLTNKIRTKQNNLKEKIRNNSSSHKGKEDNLSLRSLNSLSVEKNEKINFNDINIKEFKNNKNKKTYLTAFDALDSFNNLDYSDSEGIGINPLSKNIKNKLEKFTKHIQTEKTESNTSMELINDKNKSSLFNNNISRGSSNNSRLGIPAGSNSEYNTNNKSNIRNHYNNSKSPENKKSKNDKSFLDNYIRLPKLVVSKININSSSNGNYNNNDYSNRNHLQKELVLESKELLKGFNKTKKARNNLDSLVSKISYKIGNGFPLQKYVKNYEDFSNVYPKKSLGK